MYRDNGSSEALEAKHARWPKFGHLPDPGSDLHSCEVSSMTGQVQVETALSFCVSPIFVMLLEGKFNDPNKLH